MSRATSKDGTLRMRAKTRRRRTAKAVEMLNPEETSCQHGDVPVERGGARVWLPEGELIVTDGPFTDAKELVLSSR
jgi:hypothetical protein